MTREVRTPFTTAAVELSDGGLWRKQVLRFDTIDYTDRNGNKRKLTFDRKYGEDLIRAFKDGAYSQVPFQIADSDNRHNNDPRNTGGEVVALTLSRDGSGVDGFLRTWGEGTRVVEQNPKIGVSARILEGLETTDGRQFPRAVQHVLATVDPQMRDMHPWEKVDSVDLSNGTLSEALDLSTVTYERGAMTEQNQDGTTTLELSTAQAERLRKLLEDDEALEALADELGSEFFENVDNPQDEDDDEDDQGSGADTGDETTDLSGGQFGEALELARVQLDTQGQQIVELTNQLNERRTQNEVNELLRQGLAPAVLDLARPLLGVSPGAVELSNGVPGQAVDPGEVIREVLGAVIELANTGHLLIDPDSESGAVVGSDKDKTTRNAMLADWANYG